MSKSTPQKKDQKELLDDNRDDRPGLEVRLTKDQRSDLYLGYDLSMKTKGFSYVEIAVLLSALDLVKARLVRQLESYEPDFEVEEFEQDLEEEE